MCRFQQENMCWVTYSAVREAMEGEPFIMSLVDPSDHDVVMRAVNQGIDAHLEACFVSDRGDGYDWGTRKTASGQVITTSLECTVSVESLPVLLRRLFEDDPCSSLASEILTSLGFNDSGQHVGREAMGLE